MLNVGAASRVFFTVKTCNTDKFCSTTSCQLPSWDLDPPAFVASQDYDIQSHPSEIEGTYSAQDESPILTGTLQWAYGTSAITVEKISDTSFGSDVTPWVAVPVPAPVSAPLATVVNGARAAIKANFLFQHNQMYFLNVKAQNRLLFNGAQASKGVLIDLSPPFPGKLVDWDRCSDYYRLLYRNASVIEDLRYVGYYNAGVSGCNWTNVDNMTADFCTPTHVIDWMSTKLNDRCRGPTFLPNHRQIKDGGTVFNGDVPNMQKLWQLERTFVSLNW
jgi:hypothetical protein